MVEELKLAVKVDDDIIEQSLLKQFNNAEKLADKVVFTFKNVNLDNKEIEKQFKDMQKLAGKNPIELPIDTDKSLKMLQALGDEFTRIISIAKGTSVKPSSLFNQLIDTSDIKKGSDELNSALASAMQRMKDLYDSGQKESVEYYATLYKIIEIQKKMWQFNDMGKKSSFDSAPNVKDASERMKVQDSIFDDFKKYSDCASDTVNFVIEEFSRLKSLGEGIFGENGKVLSKSMLSSLMDLQFDGSVIEHLESQEQQALATAQAEEKLAETEKNLGKSTSTVNDSKFDELKADVTEIREELNGVKEKISAIDSEGFEHVKADVEKTVESVKELNSELAEVKSKLDSTSTSPVETNISSENSEDLKVVVDTLTKLSNLNGSISLGKIMTEAVKGTKIANEELLNILQTLRLVDKEGKVIAQHITEGTLNSGVELTDKFAIISRNDAIENLDLLIAKEKEAEEQGIILAKTLASVDVGKLHYDIQELAQGQSVHKMKDSSLENFIKETEILCKATDEQILKLYSDAQKLSDLGFKLDLNPSNLRYDEKSGFSFIDLELRKINEDAPETISIIHTLTQSLMGFMGQRNRLNWDDENSFYTQDNLSYLQNMLKIYERLKVVFSEKLDTPTFNNGFIDSYELVLSRLKELEKHFEKLGVSTTPIEDTFQGKTEASEMGKVATALDEAVQAKKDFATANEGVQASVDGSKSKLELETELMERLAKSAREAADAKKEFVEANKQVQGSVDDTGKSVKKDKYKNKSKISEDEYTKKSDEYSSFANQKLKNSGYTILGETVSTELVDGLVKVTAKIKTADDTWKTFSAKIDADGNMFEQRFRTITKGVDKLETELKNFGLETNPALSYGETLKKAEEIRSSLKLDDSYTIKVDSNELVTITQKLSDVKSSTTSVTQTFKSAQDAIEHFGKEASSSAEKTTVALKGVKASAESTGEAVDESASHLDKISTKLDKYRKDFNNFSAVPDADHRFASFETQLDGLNAAISKLETHQNALKDKGFVDEADIDETKRLSTEIDNLIEKIKKVPQSKRGYKDVAVSKMAEKIQSILEQHPRLAKKAKAEIQGYYNELASGNPTRPLDEILDRVNKIIQGQREAGRTGKGFIDILSDKALYGQAAQLAGYYLSLTDFIRYGKQAIDTIIELDTALVDLKKTTSMTSNELNQFYIDANESAKEYGVTTQEIIDQASSWSRLGYSSKEESTMMAELSSKFAAISPEMDAEQAQSGMVSIMKAWGIEVEQAEDEIISKINSLGNNFALSNADLVEGMQRSAAALAATGTTWTDAFALFTGAQEVLQSSEVAGRALRSISMRIHGYSEDSEDGLMELDEELTNITGDLIDLTKTAEHSQGVSIFKEGSTTEFKSLVDYFGEINAIWDEMSQKQQNDFLQKAFGKTQANLCLYVQKCA